MKTAGKITAEYMIIAVGALLLALGLNIFLVPSKLSPGGISSIGTALLYLFKIPLSVTNLVFNIFLFIFGFKLLGRSSVLKTLAGILFLSLFLELTSRLPQYREDIIIATAAGGVLAGAGIGMVIRMEASTGGSDFAALMLNRFFPHISVAAFILIIDCSIIAVTGFLLDSITATFYSVISLYIATKVADVILTMGNSAKLIYISSSKVNEISKRVMEQLDRGVTGIYSKGLYSDTDRMMLLCAVSPKELPVLIHMVRTLDSAAFIIISDAKEVLGEGFKSGNSYDKIKV